MKASICFRCPKALSYLSLSRICLVCHHSFCPDCFVLDETRSSIFKIQGWCLSHYTSLFFGNENNISDLPTESEHFKTIDTYVNIIELDPFSEFCKISKLGEGAFSNVYKVQNYETQKMYALKHLKANDEGVNTVFTEYYQSVISPCPNIVQSYALYKFNNEYYILEELMHMNLSVFIKECKDIPEPVIFYILKEITKGLKYIHSENQIHRDMKSENIFLDLEGNVKIGDFGNSVQLTKENDLRSTMAGSPFWLCPEIISQNLYGTPSDIWSLGIIAIELVDGHTPHQNAKGFTHLFQLITTSPSPKVSLKASKISEVFNLCTEKNPQNRPTAETLLLNPELQKDYSDYKRFIINHLRN